MTYVPDIFNAKKFDPMEFEKGGVSYVVMRSAPVGGYGLLKECLRMEPVVAMEKEAQVKPLQEIWPLTEQPSFSCPRIRSEDEGWGAGDRLRWRISTGREQESYLRDC